MSSVDPTITRQHPAGSAGAHRPNDPTARVRTTRRWAVGVLAVATAGLLAYLAAVLAAVWMFASAWDAVVGHGSGSIDALGLVVDVAPALLVGWCTGLAASAVLSRGEALGPRTAGVAAGLVGTVLGWAVLAMTGLL